VAEIVTTIGALVDAEPPLARLVSLRLDAKTRYHAVKLLRLVAAEVKEHFRAPQREAFVEFEAVERAPVGFEVAQFGPGNIMEVPPKNRAAYHLHMKKFADVPVTIPWGPLTSTMLEPYPECTGADWLALGPLFELEEPAEAAPPT
jgi:hypothetical protein